MNGATSDGPAVALNTAHAGGTSVKQLKGAPCRAVTILMRPHPPPQLTLGSPILMRVMKVMYMNATCMNVYACEWEKPTKAPPRYDVNHKCERA